MVEHNRVRRGFAPFDFEGSPGKFCHGAWQDCVPRLSTTDLSTSDVRDALCQFEYLVVSIPGCARDYNVESSRSRGLTQRGKTRAIKHGLHQ